MTHQCRLLLDTAVKLITTVHNDNPSISLDSTLELYDDRIEIRGRYPHPDSHKRKLPDKVINQTLSAIKWLEHDGYVVTNNGHNPLCFTLTQKGLHPKKITFDELCKFLAKSVLVPIVVAIITALITTYITLKLELL